MTALHLILGGTVAGILWLLVQLVCLLSYGGQAYTT